MINSTGLYSDNIVLELDNIKKLCDLFDNPQNLLSIIHVAGTNGKGSVCAFLESVLLEAGFNVGKFSSPDIKTAYDSISVNGENITPEDLTRLCEMISTKAQDFSPSHFEILTCLSFLYFKEKNCDFVILETGLGGIGDATNIIASPVCSVLTRIALDHTGFLGSTLREITEKKAGIIKKNSKTITLFNQEKDVLDVILNKCENENNTLILTKEPHLLSPINTNEHFLYDGLDLISGLSGIHQIENACLAKEVLSLLKIDDKFIKTGISTAKNPGRLETLSENLLFDGAHNPNGVSSLLASLKRYYPNREKTFIIGMMRDKDEEAVIRLFKEYNEDKLSEFLTVLVSDNPRSRDPESLKELFLKNGFSANNALTLKNALTQRKKDRLTVICGSLYLYRELFEDDIICFCS